MAYGDDARMRGQIGYQQNRFERQQGPTQSAFAYNYGQGSEQNLGDYTDIMNRYRQVYNAAGTPVEGGGGGGGGYGMVNPELIDVKDPFNSYKGYTEFSQTGGYSPEDIANMRSRGVSPIRSAYANAEREIGRQRSLQGGYSPNATATMGRMAREQGQSAADATQNVEAGLAQMRNQGRLAGLGGMEGIEGQRYDMDYKQQVYNAQAKAAAAASNASASGANAAASRAALEGDRGDQLRALSGMTGLYGTTPGLANTFGSQVLAGQGQGMQMGGTLMNAQYNAGQMPGNAENTMNRIGQVGNIISGIGGAAAPWFNRGGNQQQQPSSYTYGGGGGSAPYNSATAPYQQRRGF